MIGLKSKLLAAAAAGALALSGASAFAAAHANKVVLQLKWVTQAQFAGYFVANDKGFYEEEGLTVEIKPGGPDVSPPQVIAGGGADVVLDLRAATVPIHATLLFRVLQRTGDHTFLEFWARRQTDGDLLDVATQLIEKKTAPFDASNFKNHYTAALKALIAEKRKKGGKARVTVEDDEPAPASKGSNVVDLMATLKKSLEAVSAEAAEAALRVDEFRRWGTVAKAKVATMPPSGMPRVHVVVSPEPGIDTARSRSPRQDVRLARIV